MYVPTPFIFANKRFEYLSEGAQSVLRSLPHALVTSLVENILAAVTPDQVTGAFRRACQKAGKTEFRFHDLRPTSPSWLRISGADIHTAAQLLGHEHLRMAARYQHLVPLFLADAARKLDEVFGQLRYADGTVRAS